MLSVTEQKDKKMSGSLLLSCSSPVSLMLNPPEFLRSRALCKIQIYVFVKTFQHLAVFISDFWKKKVIRLTDKAKKACCVSRGTSFPPSSCRDWLLYWVRGLSFSCLFSSLNCIALLLFFKLLFYSTNFKRFFHVDTCRSFQPLFSLS